MVVNKFKRDDYLNLFFQAAYLPTIRQPETAAGDDYKNASPNGCTITLAPAAKSPHSWGNII